MHTVLIVIHLMVVVALVGVVLLQRSEGGALGMGGGGGGGGLMSARGAANALTRVTAILAALFFITSLSLGVLAKYSDSEPSLFDKATTEVPAGKSGTGGGILNELPETKLAPSGDNAAKTDAEPAVPNSADEAQGGGNNDGEKAGETNTSGEPSVPTGQ